jgi:undecaprenyl-diphosphatase
MDWIHALILGIVEGITEFLPISSTGHVTILSSLMGYKIDDPGITAFTAVIQIGAIIAAILYFRKDIVRIVRAWVKGIFNKKERTSLDYRFGWAVIIGSIPIAVVGFVFRHQIETVFRSLWVVAIALIVWSAVMWYADTHASQKKKEKDVGWRDTLAIGLAQCLALIPGVSRSGATASVGLLRGFDRVTATRLAFFLGIPALLAAGAYQAYSEFDNISTTVGWTPTIIGMVASLVVGYWAVAWLISFISRHSYQLFVWYRVALGLVLIVLLSTNTIAAV